MRGYAAAIKPCHRVPIPREKLAADALFAKRGYIGRLVFGIFIKWQMLSATRQKNDVNFIPSGADLLP